MNWSEANKDMAGTGAAMIRATQKALHEAKLRNEPIPIWRDNHVVWVHPDEVAISKTHDDSADAQ